MGVKASTQVSIVDITDGYNVILTSEAYTFMGDSEGAPSGLSCTTQAAAYRGDSRCSNVQIGNIICPTGITALVTNNGSDFPVITFRTTTVISTPCQAIIPVNVDEVTINKKFSFAVAKTGEKGDGMEVMDTRNDNQPPSWYITNFSKTTVVELKLCNVIGLDDGTFCTVTTVVPWKDTTAGYPKQTAKVGDTGKEYWRAGVSLSKWGSWIDVRDEAENAAKTATNFMGFESGTGLQIGNKMNGTWKGFRSRITDTAFEILNEAGSAVASYGRKLIQLGKDSTDAVIELCGGKGSIKYNLITPEYGNESLRRYGLTMTSDDISLVSDGTGKTSGSGWIEMKSRKGDYAVNTSMENTCRVSGNSVELSSFMTDTENNAIIGYCGVNGSIEGGLDLFAHGGKAEGLEAIRYNSVSFLNLLFPVGYVYMSYGDATSPAQLFGGTWEQIKGKFLYCNEGTSTGGSATHQHWQTVGLDYGDGLLYTNSGGKVTKSRVVTGQMCSYKYDGYGSNNSIREDATYEANSMPPYITVYAWVRTA